MSKVKKSLKNRYRIWFGNAQWMNDLIDAPTADDALAMAKVNFGRLGNKVNKIEFVKTIEE